MHELFKKRRSHRAFLNKKVTDEQVKDILTAAMSGPSGVHLQPWDFIVIREKETLKKISELGMWKTFVRDAPVAIMITGNALKSPLWIEDCSIAAGYIYLEATNQGLATCWANLRERGEDSGNREKVVRELLGIPKSRRILCIMPIGYPAEKISEHSEKDYQKGKVHFEKW